MQELALAPRVTITPNAIVTQMTRVDPYACQILSCSGTLKAAITSSPTGGMCSTA
jgi:hypothetical protein